MFTNVYKIINMVLGKGINSIEVIKLFLLYIPASFQLTLPISLTISILMTLGRLAADSEIISMRACGVSISKISEPIIIFSVVLTILDFFTINYFSPYCMYEARKQLNRLVSKSPAITLKEQQPIVISGKKIKINKIVNDDIYDIMILDEYKNTITAKSGKWIRKPDSIKLILNDGFIEKPVGQNYEKYDKYVFSSITVDIPAQDLSYSENPPKNDNEMSFFELLKKIKSESNVSSKTITGMYSKITIPFACISFMFIAIPIGLTAKKSGKAVGFTWGILSIFIYYVIYAGINAVSAGVNNHEIIKYIIWIPNLIISAAGIFIYKFYVIHKL